MKFFGNLFGAEKTSAVEREAPYSAKKLVGFLDEWTTINLMNNPSYAGDNEKRNLLLKNIVEQVTNLSQE